MHACGGYGYISTQPCEQGNRHAPVHELSNNMMGSGAILRQDSCLLNFWLSPRAVATTAGHFHLGRARCLKMSIGESLRALRGAGDGSSSETCGAGGLLGALGVR